VAERAFHSVQRTACSAPVVIFAPGPSLTSAEADQALWYSRIGMLRGIAIAEAYRLAPWAEVLYACDGRWWDHVQPDLTEFQGDCIGLDLSTRFPRVKIMRRGMVAPLSIAPDTLYTGRLGNPYTGPGGNSGYQAINLAVLMGATRILLLGYDMRAVAGRTHFFGARPKELAAGQFHPEALDQLVPALAAAGIEVINCTPDSAIRCFPRMSLEQALG